MSAGEEQHRKDQNWTATPQRTADELLEGRTLPGFRPPPQGAAETSSAPAELIQRGGRSLHRARKPTPTGTGKTEGGRRPRERGRRWDWSASSGRTAARAMESAGARRAAGGREGCSSRRPYLARSTLLQIVYSISQQRRVVAGREQLEGGGAGAGAGTMNDSLPLRRW